MSSSAQAQQDRSPHRLAIIATAAIQLTILLVLSWAAVIYLNWSSDAAVAEFMATAKPAVSTPNHSPQYASPVRPIHGRMACPKRA